MTTPSPADHETRSSGRVRKYDDAALAEAVAASHSWRGVLRALGLSKNAGAMIRSVRHRADSLELDYSHFTGVRGWTEAALADAVAVAGSWSEVAQQLGLVPGYTSEQRLKGHARRLGLDTDRLQGPPRAQAGSLLDAPPRLSRLRRAGSTMAATWFILRGFDVAWPLEPCRFDLLVTRDGTAHRIQVKTTQRRAGSTWVLTLSNSSRKERVTYDPDEIDYFFAIDGDFSCYLIPVAAVGGLGSINLTHYAAYKVPSLPAVA